MKILKYTAVLAIVGAIGLVFYFSVFGIGTHIKSVYVEVPRLGRAAKARLELDVDVFAKGFSKVETKANIVTNNLNSVLRQVLSAPYSDKHGYWLGNKSGVTASLRKVEAMSISSTPTGLVAQGRIRIRLRKASSRATNWYSFSLRLGVKATSGNIEIYRESINIKDLAGWIDDEILKGWKININPNSLVGIDSAGIVIESIDTFSSDGHFALASTVTIPTYSLVRIWLQNLTSALKNQFSNDPTAG